MSILLPAGEGKDATLQSSCLEHAGLDFLSLLTFHELSACR